MSEVTAQLQRDFEDMVLDACDRIFNQGVRKMIADIDKAGLILTDELKKSLYSERTLVTGQLEGAFQMGMRGYGRFKDMKQVSYSKFPNVDSLKEFIEEIGIDKFINNESVAINGKQVQLYVPGYYINRKAKKQITTDRAINRVAFGMGRARQEANTISRRKNPFYNVNKGEIYNDIGKYLTTKLPEAFILTMKEFYEKPVWERE